MRIGILGGAFDPPHLGHILVARQVRKIMNLDEIWLIPYYSHPWRRAHASVEHRLAMTKLIYEPCVQVSDIEIKRKGKSYTIDTLSELKRKYLHTFFWIVGTDILVNFSKWKEYEKLIKETSFLVIPRNGYPLPLKPSSGFKVLSHRSFISINISSSIIRAFIKKKLTIDGLVPKPVLSYIQKNNLYK